MLVIILLVLRGNGLSLHFFLSLLLIGDTCLAGLAETRRPVMIAAAREQFTCLWNCQFVFLALYSLHDAASMVGAVCVALAARMYAHLGGACIGGTPLLLKSGLQVGSAQLYLRLYAAAIVVNWLVETLTDALAKRIVRNCALSLATTLRWLITHALEVLARVVDLGAAAKLRILTVALSACLVELIVELAELAAVSWRALRFLVLILESGTASKSVSGLISWDLLGKIRLKLVHEDTAHS